MFDLFEERLPAHLAMPGGDGEDDGEDDKEGGDVGSTTTNP